MLESSLMILRADRVEGRISPEHARPPRQLSHSPSISRRKEMGYELALDSMEEDAKEADGRLSVPTSFRQPFESQLPKIDINFRSNFAKKFSGKAFALDTFVPTDDPPIEQMKERMDTKRTAERAHADVNHSA